MPNLMSWRIPEILSEGHEREVRRYETASGQDDVYGQTAFRRSARRVPAFASCCRLILFSAFA
jgi:hypothetical protein